MRRFPPLFSVFAYGGMPNGCSNRQATIKEKRVRAFASLLSVSADCMKKLRRIFIEQKNYRCNSMQIGEKISYNAEKLR